MTCLDERLRDLVLAHLVRTGMSGRRFGREAVGDRGFVASLKRGRRFGLSTADRVLVFMGHAPLGPAFRRETEAFLRATGTKAYVLGEQAAGDAGFVDRLRRGAPFRLTTVDRVRAWMWQQADAAARARCAPRSRARCCWTAKRLPKNRSPAIRRGGKPAWRRTATAI